MIIGIEAERANLPQKTGVEVYAAKLIEHLAKIDQTNQFILYFRTKPQDWFLSLPKNFTLKLIPFPKFWTQIRLSLEMFLHPVDKLLILASVLPFYHPKQSVFTAHDLAYEFFPEAFTSFMLRYLKWSTRFAAKKAAKIIAVSEATKQDLVKVYDVDPSKVVVIYLAASGNFKPMDYEQAQNILDQFGLVYQKYILFVGTLQPRKNLIRLIDAYSKLKKENHIEEKLVIIGKRGWLWEPIEEKIKKAASDGAIKYLDYVEEDQLQVLVAGASLLTLPALYEGFGLPPLEAMASGVPTVVSNISSLPEVVGDAGVMVDPYSVDSIAQGILKVLTEKSLREEMIKRGLKRAKEFSWENTAQKTLALLESL